MYYDFHMRFNFIAKYELDINILLYNINFDHVCLFSSVRCPGYLQVNISTVVSELFSAMIHHRVKQDGSFSSVIISMLVIEGLGRCLDPKVDIFTEILPYVLSSVIYNE